MFVWYSFRVGGKTLKRALILSDWTERLKVAEIALLLNDGGIDRTFKSPTVVDITEHHNYMGFLEHSYPLTVRKHSFLLFWEKLTIY